MEVAVVIYVAFSVLLLVVGRYVDTHEDQARRASAWSFGGDE